MTPQTIPGTKHPFQVYTRKSKGLQPIALNDAQARQRRGLLAKIHVAKKQMQLNEGEYEMILSSFKVGSAADLTLVQLEQMVKLLKHYGWKEIKGQGTRCKDQGARIKALRKRCVEAAGMLDNGEKRLAGLALKICGTSQLPWCRDAAKLERLLAVLEKIKKEGK
jgi:phage gp16-like protein